ncbi:hypothetical protein ACCC88_01475 [Sphingomonas sp. Sphisp140]|uniref:hypothetical protein n=2 Tax=Sphingomonadaceae TaxID=41297 RepID=UPI0039B0D6DF
MITEATMTESKYYAQRADEARGAAMRAKGMASFRAHMGMAHEYERRARGFEPRHADNVVLD